MPAPMTLPYTLDPAARPADVALWYDVHRFIAAECALLDERRFAEWGGLLADDLRYYAPARYTRLTQQAGREWSGPQEAAHFDDSKMFMAIRIKRLLTQRSASEEPPARTRHLTSNLQVFELPDGKIEARTDFLVYRARDAADEEWFLGARRDILRRTDSAHGFEIVERTILFDHTTILANNLGLFF